MIVCPLASIGHSWWLESVAWLTLLLRHITGGSLVVTLNLLLLAGRRGTASALHRRRLAAGWRLFGGKQIKNYIMLIVLYYKLLAFCSIGS